MKSRSLRSLIPLSAGFFLLLMTAASAVFLHLRQQEAGLSVRHTLEVDSELNRIETMATSAETGQRGFLLTGRTSYLEPYEAARRELAGEIDKLAAETADNTAQQQAISRLRAAVSRKLAELQQTVDLRSNGKPDAALDILNNDSGQELMGQIRELIGSMRAEERRVLEERSAFAAWLSGWGEVVLVGSVVVVIVLAAFALVEARRRVDELESSYRRLEAEGVERRAAEGQVRQLQKMEAIGQLTSGIAHDFNNMLAIVLGSLDLASRRLTGNEHAMVGKCIESAIEGTRRAALLTARLLAFSRQQPLDPRVVDANKLVGGMSDLIRRTIGERVQVETVLAAGLWLTFVDPTQLESALVNLAVNSRDAMPDGGKLTIETGNSELDERYARSHAEVKPGQYAMVSVTDSGTGMTPEVAERVFDPFYTTKGDKGTGLGLSQVFGFVKQSGGHIKIYSEVGHGTTIKIYLPRFTGQATNLDVEKVDAPGRGTAGEIILVVEDDASVRQMSVEALRELGYTVVEAATPAEALQHIESQPNIALLFTDVVMPGMSGRQLADRALARRPDLKVIYTTGYTRNAVVHNGVLDPGIAFLPKPFTLEQLGSKVRQFLDGQSERVNQETG